MPALLYLLAVAVFAQGTSEFLLAGLLTGISSDFGVTIPQAGLLTSAFAVGMVVGAPLMAALGRNLSPRWTLTGFLAVFIAMHLVGAVTNDFGVLLATRVVSALANAGFLAVTFSTVSTIVAPAHRTRALAVVLGGTTAALIVGVPAGALIGSLWSWRIALLAIAAISVPALIAVLVATPTTLDEGDRARPLGTLGSELRTLLNPLLQLVLLLAVLVNAATFCTFTYLAPIVTNEAELDEWVVPAVLALFGVGAFIGVAVAGRLADRYGRQLLIWGAAAHFCGWILLAVAAAYPVALCILVFIQGGLSFAVGSALIGRVMMTAQEAPTMGGSFATVALNLGAIIGPILGGVAFGWFAEPGPVFVSAALILMVLLIGPAHGTLMRPGRASTRPGRGSTQDAS